MVDPLTAFAAAGNALQFAELAVNLIRKSVEYSAGGGSREHQKLQDLLQQLNVSNAHLRRSLEENDAQRQCHGAAKALYFANEECLKLSQELCHLLGGFKLDRSCTLWRSIRLALKSLTTKAQFQTLVGRLEQARANLTLSLLVYLQEQTSFTNNERRSEYQELHHQLAKVNQQTKYTKSMVSNVGDLAAKFTNLDLDEQHLRSEWIHAVRKDTLCLQPVARHLLHFVSQPNDDLQGALDQLQQIIPVMNNEVRTRQEVLKSLLFNKIHSRRNQVKRAHQSTFQWLFKHKQDNSVWYDFVDWLCVDKGRRVYWISGKPGSGKTTLMRELDEFLVLRMTAVDRTAPVPAREGIEWLETEREGRKDLKSLANLSLHRHQSKGVEESSNVDLDFVEDSALARDLSRWVGSEKLIVATSYFWYAGAAEEQSIQGLLLSLTHQLLSQRPDLIDKVVPQQIWQSAAASTEEASITWEESDLTTTLANFAQLTQNDDRILLLIDGLDECGGDDDDQREHLLDLIRSLTSMNHVKACVASRPWNIFRDAFRDHPQLQLEDLTRDDINRFVTDKLKEDRNFQYHCRHHDGLLEEITQKVTGGARGVFLWVHLVVRDLLRVLRDGGRGSDLLREFERMPRNLEDYFQRMLKSIDPLYRGDAAMIMQTALCKMDYECDAETLVSGPDLMLIHLEYLSEDGTVDVTAQENLESAYHPSRSYVLDYLDRRVASRCMGLLEIDTFATGHEQYVEDGDGIFRLRTTSMGDDFLKVRRFTPEKARIEFLHRTVRDFLCQASSQRLLRGYSTERFDSHWFRCNMLVLDAAAYHAIGCLTPWANAITCFLAHIIKGPGNEQIYRLYDRMVQVITNSTSDFGEHAFRVPMRGYKTLAEAAVEWAHQGSNAMSLAIQLGWTPYILSRSSQQVVESKTGRDLLEYALRPRYDGKQKPDSRIVSKLLDVGADPDRPAFDWTDIPTWAFYFESLQYSEFTDDHRSSLVILRLVLRRGCHRRISRHQLLSIPRELCRRPLDDIMIDDEPSTPLQSAEDAISTRLKLLYPESFDMDGNQPVYSAMDVLRSLATMTGPEKGRALFGDSVLDELERCATTDPSFEMANGQEKVEKEDEVAAADRQRRRRRSYSPTERFYSAAAKRVRW